MSSPELSPSQEDIIRNITKDIHQMDDIIDGYNQMIDNIQQIVEKFQFHYTFTNNHNESITFRYKLLSNEHPVIVDREHLIKCQKLTERQGSDFQLQFVFDMIFLISCDEVEYQIPKTYRFTLTIPVITGVKYDPITSMTAEQRWINGLNTSYTGGNIILSGVKYLLPRIFSYPMNKPIIVKANKKHQLVRCEYIKQDDVFYGNSYHTFYAITDYHDIVINFRQSFDTRLLPQKSQKLIFVPVILMFYAYGIKTDEEILRLCNPNKDQQLELFLIVHFRASNQPHMNQAEAKQAIAQLILKPEFYNDIDDVLNKYIYPLDEANIYPYQLGEIVQIMYKVYLNKELAQDKMDLTNKRIKTVPLQFITEFRSKMQETYKKEMIILQSQIKNISFKTIVDSQGTLIDKSLQGYIKNLQNHLEATVKKSFTSVNSLNTTSTLKKVQDDNKSKILTIQQIKEIVIRQEGPVKVPFDRCRVHLSYFGLVDTIQSPESGAEVGRYLSPNMYTYTTSAYDDKQLIKFIKPYLQEYGSYTMPVKVNYRIIGFIHWDKFKNLYNKLMDIREPFVSVFYNIIDQQLCVCTDVGRLMTPIVAPDVTAKELATIPFATLIEQHKVLYVCAEMMQNFIIRQWTDNDCSTYRFLPSGLVAAFNAINPFCINMKSCRSSLFTSQGKQAIQQPLSNHMCDCSNAQLYAHFLQYGPTDTEIQRTVYEKFPIGNIGYATFIQTAFNQEDAMIVNEGYIKRNALSTSEYRSFDTSIQNRSEKFGISEADKGTIIDNQHFMADQIGLRVEYGTPLIGKLTQIKKVTSEWLDYKKVKYPYNYQCQFAAISNVIKSSLSPYAQTKIVRTELRRYPIVGDKIISKNCQKGCIGQILKEYQMPINSIGIVSSFLLSGQSILKRETYGQAIEPVHNKWLAETHELVANVSMDNPIQNMQKLTDVQNDKVYGIENPLLAGPMIFSSQCHLVSRKIRARNTGEIDILSRQPASGKKHNGGIRQGNMEEIALESQGISSVIKNQTGINSSNTRWYYCRQCNCDQVYYNILTRSYYCPSCGKLTNQQVGNGSYNYSEQIISQTLYSIGVGMKIYE